MSKNVVLAAQKIAAVVYVSLAALVLWSALFMVRADVSQLAQLPFNNAVMVGALVVAACLIFIATKALRVWKWPQTVGATIMLATALTGLLPDAMVMAQCSQTSNLYVYGLSCQAHQVIWAAVAGFLGWALGCLVFFMAGRQSTKN